jgi:hypothetical protein
LALALQNNGFELIAAGTEFQTIADEATRCGSSSEYWIRDTAKTFEAPQLRLTEVARPLIQFTATTSLPPGLVLTAVV